MEVVVFRECESTGNGRLPFALADARLRGVVLDAHRAAGAGRRMTFAVPHAWATVDGDAHVLRYSRKAALELQIDEPVAKNESDANAAKWLVISNGASLCKANREWVEQQIECLAADVVCVTFDPALSGYHEKIRTTQESEIVGWRRYYDDGIELCATPEDWPHRVFVRMAAFRKVWPGKALTGDFAKFVSACSANSLRMLSVRAAGRVLDLHSEQGLLGLVREAGGSTVHGTGEAPEVVGDCARIVGPVVFGRGVQIGTKAVIVGPAFLGDGVHVGDGAVLKRVVIASNLHVPADAVVCDRVMNDGRAPQRNGDADAECTGRVRTFSEDGGFERDYFRTWRPWSYPRYIKRLFDVVTSGAILLLFLPFFPVIALAIKLSSPGPVFYRARRQGLGGKEFDCLKFRTMVPTAEGLQEKLRAVNQVDGPQFKMENDPRVNAVGRFLRDTNIDEIPQFINVLRGQMSMIGPRPSPEHENTGCPQWRYARLSVRPGITGMWQLCRTREEGKDFQEWVHYDSTYVRTLSFKTDLWIFWKTAEKLINDFVDQF